MAKRTKRHDGRRVDQHRPVTITPDFVRTADGSCLIETGGTRVICTASIVPGVPPWREELGLGWVTAEYGMLPASTARRKPRPAGKPDSRGIEIKRLIGRVLRSVVRFDRLGPNTIYLDCDVLEADGGTRTAGITGAQVALSRAIRMGREKGLFQRGAVAGLVAATSVGMVDGAAVLDLDYLEDSTAEVDMNIAMTQSGEFIELQGTAERRPFTREQLDAMLDLAAKGIKRLMTAQRKAIRGDTA
ncbi:MAG: ribonuclease PH [Planctomycetota bacterium]